MSAECPKCKNTTFVAEHSVAENLGVDILIIKCKSCNAAIGVFDSKTYDRVKKIAKHLRLE